MLTNQEQAILKEAVRVSNLTKANIEIVLDRINETMKAEFPAIAGIVFKIKNHIAIVRQSIA